MLCASLCVTLHTFRCVLRSLCCGYSRGVLYTGIAVASDITLSCSNPILADVLQASAVLHVQYDVVNLCLHFTLVPCLLLLSPLFPFDPTVRLVQVNTLIRRMIDVHT